MNDEHDNLNRLLDIAMSGRLDDLTPQQIALVEQHLNDYADAALRFRDVLPPPDHSFGSHVAAPTKTEWNAIWQRIESADDGRDASVRRLDGARIRVYPMFRSITAVAACIALLLVWRFGPHAPIAASAAGWDVRLSASNQILELAMSGNASPTVHYDEDGIAVIDYHESESPPEGASDEDDESAAALPPPVPQPEPVRRVVR